MHRALNDYGAVLRLTLNGAPWEEKGIEVNDLNYPFLIHRQVKRDKSQVVWTASVLRRELPAINTTDVIGFEVLAGGAFAAVGE